MADLVISDELKVSKEELLLGDITIQKVGCGEFRTVHGLLANDLSVRLPNNTVIPLLDYISTHDGVVPNTLLLVGNTSFTLEENRPIGTFIGNLGADGGTPPYVFSTTDSRFRVQSNRLETNAVFDYETNTTPITINIKVTDSVGVYNIRAYTITILDVAETPLALAVDAGAWSVDEHSTNGTSVGTLTATGGVSPYTMALSDTSKFYLNDAGAISVNGDIEYDDGATITVHATVTDSIGATATVDVPISIAEVVVGNPLALSITPTYTLAEHTATGTTLTTASASGGTAPYTYSMSGAAFDIDVNTGVITVAADIEYDTSPSITSTVTVTDSVGGTSSTLITVTITEVTTLAIVNNYGALTLNEHTTIGTDVGALTGVNGNVANYAWSSSMATPLTVGTSGGDSMVVKVAADIEYDNTTSITMPITLTDGVETVTQNFTWSVVEVTPLVASNGLFNVDEGLPPWTVVGNLTITGGVTPYTITIDGGSTDFGIANNGQITTMKTFDFETTDSYALDITVQDSAGQSDTCHIVIDINDILDTLNNNVAYKSQVTTTDDVNVHKYLIATDEGGGNYNLGYSEVVKNGNATEPSNLHGGHIVVNAEPSWGLLDFCGHTPVMIYKLSGSNDRNIVAFSSGTAGNISTINNTSSKISSFGVAGDTHNCGVAYIDNVNQGHFVVYNIAFDATLTVVGTYGITEPANTDLLSIDIMNSPNAGEWAIIAVLGHDTVNDIYTASMYRVLDDLSVTLVTTHTLHEAPVTATGADPIMLMLDRELDTIAIVVTSTTHLYQAYTFNKATLAYESVLLYGTYNNEYNFRWVYQGNNKTTLTYTRSGADIVGVVYDFLDVGNAHTTEKHITLDTPIEAFTVAPIAYNDSTDGGYIVQTIDGHSQVLIQGL